MNRNHVSPDAIEIYRDPFLTDERLFPRVLEFMDFTQFANLRDENDDPRERIKERFWNAASLARGFINFQACE